jgi:hypothetical protein
MQIVDIVYLGCESEVGSLISRDQFEVAQIRLRLLLYMLFFYMG